jgi:hypothetical protein
MRKVSTYIQSTRLYAIEKQEHVLADRMAILRPIAPQPPTRTGEYVHLQGPIQGPAIDASDGLRPKTAFSPFPPVDEADLERVLRVDLTRSPHRLAMTAICAKPTAGVDVKQT